MPDIYEYFGFVFSFYSREHEPIHVHAQHGDKESIFDLIIKDDELVEIRTRHHGEPMSGKDEAIARKFIEIHWRGIVTKWVNRFVYNKKVTCTHIRKKNQMIWRSI